MSSVSKIKQAGLLATGFLVGQGLYFIGCSRLVAAGDIENLGSIGMMLGVLALAQWLGDCGGIIVQARLVDQNIFWNKIASFLLARIIVGILFFAVLYGCFNLAEFYFSDEIWILAMINLAVWALNFNGLLDYLKKNKIVGPMSGLNWALPGLALTFSPNYFSQLEFAIIFTVGTVVTVMLHWYEFIKLAKNNFKIVSFSLFDVWSFSKEFFTYNIGFASAQSYARVAPVLINSLSGAEVAGIYIYAKGITNSIGQVFVFLRRASHADFVRIVGDKSKFRFLSVLKTQKISLIFLVISSLGISLTLQVYNYMYATAQSNIINFCAAMVIIMPIWGVSQIFGVMMVIKNKSLFSSVILALASCLGIFLISLWNHNFGVLYFVFVELIVYLSILIAIIIRMKNS